MIGTLTQLLPVRSAVPDKALAGIFLQCLFVSTCRPVNLTVAVFSDILCEQMEPNRSRDDARDEILASAGAGRLLPRAAGVDFTWKDVCDPSAAAFRSLYDTFQDRNVCAVIGLGLPLLPRPFHSAALALVAVYQKGYIASSSSSSSIIITQRGSGVVSLSPSLRQLSASVVSFLDFFRWQHVVVVVVRSDPDGFWTEVGTSLFVELTQNDFRVKLLTFSPDKDTLDTTLLNRNFSAEDKAVILCLGARDISRTLLQSANTSLVNGQHAIFVLNTSPYLAVLEFTKQLVYLSSGSPTDTKSLENAYQYMFIVSPNFPRKLQSGPGLNSTAGNSSRIFTGHGAMLNDSIRLLAHVLNATTGSCPTQEEFVSSIKGKAIRGLNGWLVMDEEARVMYDFNLFHGRVRNFSFQLSHALRVASQNRWSLEKVNAVIWPSGAMIAPDACFKTTSECLRGDFNFLHIIFILLTTVVFTGVAVGCGILGRRFFSKKEMEKGPNKILLALDDLVFVHRKNLSKSSKMLQKSALFEKPDLLRASEPSHSMSTLNEITDFSETARYNGDMVKIKDLKIKFFELKSKTMHYLKILREMRHENLNSFIGFLNDPTKPAFIMEYCTRGSLEDVIHNDDIKLDWDFKLSLLTDLVRGCRYMHSSPLKFHGNLKSRNCVIDSRWVLKLTDYGIPGFMERAKQSRSLEPKDLLWTAPEILREPPQKLTGSEKSDVYSLSIIAQELILRNTPYCTTGLTPEEIIQKVKKPPPLIRPSVTPQAAPPQYIQLMKQCWAEMPDMRPDIETIYQQFKMFNNGKKMNIVDTMFKLLEKYSNDLEDIVQERTMQLEEEKKKTNELLYRMMPSTVADKLKLGKPIAAETYAEVTIYFSDIVGFTTISAMSTPMQVVDLLNDLYTMFDGTIDNYDVYKVETIGDAYMVVSGLPVPNENKHTGEICTMALDLLSQCGSFRIRNMQDIPLRLRIGIHTAFRIHLSQQTKEKLDILTGYTCEFRGEVELKGKGLAKAYWLIGKEGFTKPLPEVPQQNGEDNHGLASLVTQSRLAEEVKRTIVKCDVEVANPDEPDRDDDSRITDLRVEVTMEDHRSASELEDRSQRGGDDGGSATETPVPQDAPHQAVVGSKTPLNDDQLLAPVSET